MSRRIQKEAHTWRQLIRAAHERQAVFQEGAAPNTLHPPSVCIEHTLERLLHWREGRALAADHPAVLNDKCLPTWNVDGQQAEQVRDADDVLGGIMEVLTPEGSYYWVDLADIENLTLAPFTKPLDRLWRDAKLTLVADKTPNGKTEYRVFVPLIYPQLEPNESAQVGRITNWVQAHGQVRGQGLKMFWLNENSHHLYDCGCIQAVKENVHA
ncbi:MAG: hypothetical protein HC848_04905 [Limnobacter sp.]|nr:hypothetical protein [Limnobacter sp.]